MKTVLDWLLRLLLAAVLGYAGAAKLRDPAAFAVAIENFDLVPSGLAALLAVYLPWLELLTAAGLLLPRWRAAAALIACALFAVFAAATALAWARGLDIDCGCFGHASATSPHRALLRDLALLVVALGALRLAARRGA